MTERNGADVVREYMASPNNPMRVLIREWRAQATEFWDLGLDGCADELEAALADTGELVSAINYLVETGRAAPLDTESVSPFAYARGDTAE